MTGGFKRDEPDGSRSTRRSGILDVAVFSTKDYDRQFLDAANTQGICRLHYFDATLGADTVGLAAGHEVACVFVCPSSGFSGQLSF